MSVLSRHDYADSTSVQKITEVVTLMLSALTPWAAISVSVNQDTREMEKYARISKPNLSILREN